MKNRAIRFLALALVLVCLAGMLAACAKEPAGTQTPTQQPAQTQQPTQQPTAQPTQQPTPEPTAEPTPEPTGDTVTVKKADLQTIYSMIGSMLGK